MEIVSGPESLPVIAIVGGGFSGTMVAVHLARLGASGRFRVVLFEKGNRFARGLAYGTRCEHHLLNVPAGNMSALPDEPSHFLDWLRRRDPSAHAGTFAQRRLYGEYLEELLVETIQRSKISIHLVKDEVVDVTEAAAPGPLWLRTRGGDFIKADRLALCLGHPESTPPDSLRGARDADHYVENPWCPGALAGLASGDSIAFIGTGLTAVDLIVQARAEGHRGRIYAISRHGLRPHRHQETTPRPHFMIREDRPTARSLLGQIRSEVATCRAEGGDWRSVVDSVRPAIQGLWRSLGRSERERFVRHLAPRWDVHRHRVAPQIAGVIDVAEREGQLVFLAGRVLSIADRGGGMELTVCRRGEAAGEKFHVRRIINCTGPSRDIRSAPSRLLQSLFERGIVRPGPLKLGLDTLEHGPLVNRDGASSSRVFAIGPLLKENLWESTAVRELRIQAQELAKRISRES